MKAALALQLGVLEAYAADPSGGQGQSALSLLETRNPIHVGCGGFGAPDRFAGKV